MTFEEMNGFTPQNEYPYLVEAKIRRRYSISAEIAILRQRDTKVEEWTAYNIYCEECKAEARRELGI